MKIIGSFTSPYVRFVRTVCGQLGLAYELDLTVHFSKNQAKEGLVKEHNPVMRVPVLIDGETEVFESRVIVRHLARLYGTGVWSAEYFDVIGYENDLSVLYGLMEAAVLTFNLKNQHPEIKADTGYMARSMERIASSFEWLEKQQGFGTNFTYAEMFLVCVVEWLTKRNIYDWKRHPRIAEIHAAYADQPALVHTRIPADV